LRENVKSALRAHRYTLRYNPSDMSRQDAVLDSQNMTEPDNESWESELQDSRRPRRISRAA
jgi:hypothetical protein